MHTRECEAVDAWVGEDEATLSSEAHAALGAHLAVCADCAALHRALAAAELGDPGVFPVPPPPADLVARVMAEVRTLPSPARLEAVPPVRLVPLVAALTAVAAVVLAVVAAGLVALAGAGGSGGTGTTLDIGTIAVHPGAWPLAATAAAVLFALAAAVAWRARSR